MNPKRYPQFDHSQFFIYRWRSFKFQRLILCAVFASVIFNKRYKLYHTIRQKKVNNLYKIIFWSKCLLFKIMWPFIQHIYFTAINSTQKISYSAMNNDQVIMTYYKSHFNILSIRLTDPLFKVLILSKWCFLTFSWRILILTNRNVIAFLVKFWWDETFHWAWNFFQNAWDCISP